VTFERADNASLRPAPTWSLADAGAVWPVKREAAMVLIPAEAESSAVPADATAVASLPLEVKQGQIWRCALPSQRVS
jgi:hypothetical protein